jgi:hypothetical protein
MGLSRAWFSGILAQDGRSMSKRENCQAGSRGLRASLSRFSFTWMTTLALLGGNEMIHSLRYEPQGQRFEAHVYLLLWICLCRETEKRSG